MRSGAKRLLGVLVAGAAAGLAGACARQGAPPGGPEDRRPPVVVATVPDTFAVLTEPFRGPVEFVFDERISERVAGGSLDQAVIISPRTGDLRVSHDRQSIKVDLQGGFRPGLVYRVTLLPVVRDLFNNALLAPFELVFSTGGEFNASAVAGTAWDRITAEGVQDLQVVAVADDEAEPLPHAARTDSAGVYVFRYLPPASYRVVAFQDRNRNGVADRMELQGETVFQVGGADTLFVDVPVLQPDTTPARLTRATPLDSVTVVLDFDEFLDPLSAAGLMGVTLTREETGALVPLQVLHEREYVAWRAQLQDSFARLDSLEAARRAEDALEDIPLRGDSARADTARADTAVAAPGPARPAQQPRASRPLPPELPAATGGGRPAPGVRPGPRGVEALTPDGRPLPARRLVLRLESFLEASARYDLFAGSVVNINGLGGGGGESAVIFTPPPDSTRADSLAVPGGAPPDTSVAPPDTGRVDPGRRPGRLFLPERRR
ncbi:MAG: hypothetical protein AMXMBFR53_29820 [Gemmatimonadota bacterium]